MAREIRKIGVIGAGQMGSGIAHVCALAGYEVVIHDVSEDRLKSSLATIHGNMARQVSSGKVLEADRNAALERIATNAEVEGLADADLVIEAATENEAVKREVFAALAPVLKPDAMLATNTSSLSITRLASAHRPAGALHRHPLHEPGAGNGTGRGDPRHRHRRARPSRRRRRSSSRLGKTIVVAEDFPGFIVNRILLPMINEAIYTLHEGVGTVTAIDSAMRLGAHHPMGPLQLADFIGLDTCLSIMQVLYEGLATRSTGPARCW